MRQYFIGVDWGDQWNGICVFDDGDQVVLQKQVANTPDGLSEFGRWLLECRGQGVLLLAAIEKMEGRIIDYLLDHGVEVYPINPKAVDRARDQYRANRAKSDLFDAWVLANMLRKDHAHFSVLKPNSDSMAELKMLTRDYQSLVHQQTRLINQIKAALKEYYPQPLAVFGGDLTTATCLDFLRAYATPEALEKLTWCKWEKFGKKHRMRSNQIQEGWQLLQAPTLCVPAHVVRVRSKLVLVLVEQLRVTANAVEEFKEQIETFFSSLPVAELTSNLPGGKSGVTIPTVFAEIGDAPGRWESFQHLQAQGGMTPYTRQSGKVRTVHFRFACNKRLRYAVDWMAFISLRQSEWAKAYYDRQRARGHGHREALRALGAKWLKILFVMCRDQVPYNENYHLANIARQHFNQAVLA